MEIDILLQATGGGDCGVCLCYLNDNADSDDNLPKSLTIDLHNKQVEIMFPISMVRYDKVFFFHNEIRRT